MADDSSNPFKRLKVSDDAKELTWRGSPRFSDWTLRWGNTNFQVHRVVLVHGHRAAHFFAGATNEGLHANSTDLEQLLPPSCQAIIENILDFIYGGKLLFKLEELPAMYKAGDILQCPSLQNHVADELMKASRDEGNLRKLLDAIIDIEDESLMKAITPLLKGDVLHDLAPKLVQLYPQLAVELIQTLAKDALDKDDACMIEVSAADLSWHEDLERIVGKYQLHGVCQGKPCYKKIKRGRKDLDNFIYYWPEMNGGRHYTWWMGPVPGSDKVLAGNTLLHSSTPPGLGWQIPWNSAAGPCPGFTLNFFRCAAACPHVVF
eukprot:TRINITY_DN113402_c0_g1_i1.p1 TRINITY_DN113402_c0_g1~~TRINITY_DN113402_c0_g1_i1.p1  ORF type:complete len:319 (+),score=56.67 TRINITY_DN113402_c0_g1_i1:59-1015(+)